MRTPALRLTSFLLTWSFAAHAENPEKTVEIETVLQESVVATPTRSSAIASSAPAVTSTLSADDLERYGIRSLSEAINFLALGMISQIDTSRARLGDQEVGARGVFLNNNNQVLLLLNGHAVNDEFPAVAYWLDVGGLPIELVDRIEVMLGPGSVLYGANAMVGVINIVTKRAGEYHGVHAVTEWSVVPASEPTATRAGFASRHALGAGSEFHLLGLVGEATLQVQLAQKQRPTYTYGTADRERWDESSFVAPSVTGRVALGKWDLTIHADGTQSEESPRALVPIRVDGPQGPAGEGHRTQRLNVDLNYRHQVTRPLALAGRLFADATRSDDNLVTYDGLYNCPQKFAAGCVTNTALVAPRVGLELQGTYDWTTNGSISTMIGVTGLVRRVNAATNVTDTFGQNAQNELDIDRAERAAAAYIQQILMPARTLSFNLGARFDYESRFGQKLSPRVAAVYSPWAGANLKAIYSEAFRGPTVFESFFHTPTTLIQAGPLEPETVKSAEVFLDQRFSTHRIYYGVFRTWWSSLVATSQYQDYSSSPEDQRAVVEAAKQRGELNPIVPAALRFGNVETVDNFGLNGGFEGSENQDRIRYGANLVLAQALTRSGPIEAAPRAIANARFSYDLGGGLPTLAAAMSFAGHRFGSWGDPYPTETHVRPTVSGAFPGFSGLSYRAMFDYAFNRKSAWRWPEPPDNVGYALFPSERYTFMLGLHYQLLQ